MTTPAANRDPAANAWQVHAALVAWTSSVDSKASFALGLETGVLAGAVSLRGSEDFLKIFNNDVARISWAVAVVLLGFAVLITTMVVAPRLNSRKLSKDTSGDYIFFGHLAKQYEGVSKTAALVASFEQKPMLEVLVRQLQIMSKIAWQKHRRLQWAMAIGFFGALTLGISIVTN